MPIKLIPIKYSHKDEVGTILFWCPACGESHPYTAGSASEENHRWSFNGDYEKPSFEPSLRVFTGRGTPLVTQCHCYVTNGEIRYCGDCSHEFAGKTIPLPDFPIDDPWHPDYESNRSRSAIEDDEE